MIGRYARLLNSCLCQPEGETYVAVTFLLMPTSMTVALISLLHFAYAKLNVRLMWLLLFCCSYMIGSYLSDYIKHRI